MTHLVNMSAVDFGSASMRKVCARSSAEMPVVVSTLQSTVTVKAVSFGS